MKGCAVSRRAVFIDSCGRALFWGGICYGLDVKSFGVFDICKCSLGILPPLPQYQTNTFFICFTWYCCGISCLGNGLRLPLLSLNEIAYQWELLPVYAHFYF